MRMRGKEYIKFNEPLPVIYCDKDLHYLQYKAGKSSIMQCNVTMAESICVEALEKALETSLNVHPLFRACAFVEDGQLFTYFGNSPITIFSDEGTTHRGELCSPNVNPYQFRVSTDGDIIRLIAHHCLTDGHGLLRFLSTLLYYYLLYRGLDVSADASITTLDTPFQKEELQALLDELHQIPAKKALPNYSEAPFRPKVVLRSSGLPVLRTEIHIPLHQVLKLSAMTHSPVSVIASIFSMAARRYEQSVEANTLPIYTHISVDLRQLFGDIPWMGNSSASFTVLCTPRDNKLPLEDQIIGIHNQVKEQLKAETFHGYDPGALLARASKPSEKPNGLSQINLLVTNMGKVSFNESMSRHITKISMDALLDYVLLYTGILSYGDDMCLFFDHQFDDITFFRVIESIFKENGLDAHLVECGQQPVPKLVFARMDKV